MCEVQGLLWPQGQCGHDDICLVALQMLGSSTGHSESCYGLVILATYCVLPTKAMCHYYISGLVFSIYSNKPHIGQYTMSQKATGVLKVVGYLLS